MQNRIQNEPSTPSGHQHHQKNQYGSSEASAAEVKVHGFAEVELRSDLNGKLRMLRASRTLTP
ncbi:MAG: hypothetical protein KatS3mg030_767 [Saprospiraceae bacterium]|nr:MAG: hypothetical protein KatS3mg030_767 [Saprospiraceae bacterium]